jgi:hypothetical protein
LRLNLGLTNKLKAEYKKEGTEVEERGEKEAEKSSQPANRKESVCVCVCVCAWSSSTDRFQFQQHAIITELFAIPCSNMAAHTVKNTSVYLVKIMIAWWIIPLPTSSTIFASTSFQSVVSRFTSKYALMGFDK